MITWLWEASGSEHCARGITDGQERARAIVEAYLLSGLADVATVEGARIALGVYALDDVYERTGKGWRGRVADSGICWEPFTCSERAASLRTNASSSVLHVTL